MARTRFSSLLALGVVAIVALAAAGCTSSAGQPTWTYTPAGLAAAVPTPGASGAGAALGTVDVKAVDLAFQPMAVSVPAPGRYTVNFTNGGAIQHDMTFADGTTTGLTDPGTTTSVAVDVPAAGLPFICSVPGHAAAGMKGTISVAGAAPGGMDMGGASPAPATQVQADPSAPKYVLYPAEAPKVLSGTVHDIDLVIQEKDMTVADGFVQKVWAFGTTETNATVPGPVIRVHLGDTVRIHLKNPASNTMSHSVDFHASQVAMNDEMTSIKPGEEKLYEFTADYAGVWMYHCGTDPTLQHIASGMYGMLIVEPKGGFAPVDTELALVQSEWYLGPQGDIPSFEKASAGNPSPDFVVFNGVANQYKDNPIKVPTKGSVRIFLLDAGPDIDSSFHIVGTIFNAVTKEGIQLLPNNAGGYGSQAVDLSPAQGAIIELSPQEDGLYPIVTHAFNFVGRGAVGLLQAGDGNPLN